MRDQVMVTFPKMGRSTDPHVSAPQWTSPDAKSAVSIPAAENERVRKVRTTNTARKNWRTLYNFSYQCSTGCTTDVPGGNWQEGEWNWRPWERSRGRHLSILDIFCLKGKTPWLNMEHFSVISRLQSCTWTWYYITSSKMSKGWVHLVTAVHYQLLFFFFCNSDPVR